MLAVDFLQHGLSLLGRTLTDLCEVELIIFSTVTFHVTAFPSSVTDHWLIRQNRETDHQTWYCRCRQDISFRVGVGFKRDLHHRHRLLGIHILRIRGSKLQLSRFRSRIRNRSLIINGTSLAVSTVAYSIAVSILTLDRLVKSGDDEDGSRDEEEEEQKRLEDEELRLVTTMSFFSHDFFFQSRSCSRLAI